MFLKLLVNHSSFHSDTMILSILYLICGLHTLLSIFCSLRKSTGKSKKKHHNLKGILHVTKKKDFTSHVQKYSKII